jgi:hypothetical protein
VVPLLRILWAHNPHADPCDLYIDKRDLIWPVSTFSPTTLSASILSSHPSLLRSRYIYIMSQSSCYIGVAFYSSAPLYTRWALVLSENTHFMGRGWGSTASDTVDGGVIISWVPFERSPAGFDTRAQFLGIVRVALVRMSINNLKPLISSSNRASVQDRTHVPGTDDILWGTEKYVVLAILRLYEGGYLRPPRLRRDDLARFIGGRICDLLRRRCVPGGTVYPVVSLDSGNISFGHSS